MKAKDIKRLLVLDTETTGLSPGDSRTIEVAVALYDIDHCAVVASFASLICADSNAAEHVNHIPVSLLLDAPVEEFVWSRVFDLARCADIVVAHRAEFDRGFVPEHLRELRPWTCSKFDIEWPKGNLGDHLVHLALAHDVPVYTAHRAMADVDTLVRTFQAASKLVDVSVMLEKAMRPKVKFIALVSFEDKDKAKAAGFAWNAANKAWERSMPEEDTKKLPFKVKKVA